MLRGTSVFKPAERGRFAVRARARLVLLMLALALAAALLGAAGATVAQADTVTPVPNEPHFLAAVSCADAGDQHCVAITQPEVSTSPVVSQLVPISGGAAGTPVNLPEGFQAWSVACPSATSCVIAGVDGGYYSDGHLIPEEGAVVSVINGVVGSPQEVPGVYVLAGVACSVESNCVAVGPPAGGGQGTSPAFVVPISNGIPGPAQSVPGAHQLSGVACSDSTHCITVGNNNSVQVVVSITDGEAGPAQPVARTSLNDTLEGVACAPGTTSCLAVGAGVLVPISNGAPGAAVPLTDQQGGTPPFLEGISCPNTNGCVASGELDSDSDNVPPSGAILPVGLDGTPGVMRTEPGASFLRGIECADPFNCIAVGHATPVTTGGAVIVQVHESPVSPSAAVSTALTVSGAASSIRAILKAGGYPATCTAPKPGKVQVSWYYLPPGAHLAKVTRPVLVARGSKQFTAPGQATIKIALTAQGRSLLKKGKMVKLTALGSFTPNGGKPTTKRKVITLKPR